MSIEEWMWQPHCRKCDVGMFVSAESEWGVDNLFGDTAAGADVLTEVEEAFVGSRSGVSVSWRKPAGAWTVRTQQVSKQVRSRSWPRRTHTGANSRAGPHPKRIKQVTHSCKTDTVSGGKCIMNSLATTEKLFSSYCSRSFNPYVLSLLWPHWLAHWRISLPALLLSDQQGVQISH